MSNWVETEMEVCRLHDARHAKRLAQLLARLSEKPVHSIPRARHGWAETVAAYRFLDNPAIGEQELLSGHKRATLERMRA
jgi:Transposase DNA-binding